MSEGGEGGGEVGEGERGGGDFLLGEGPPPPSHFSLDWGLSNIIVFTNLFHEISSQAIRACVAKEPEELTFGIICFASSN